MKDVTLRKNYVTSLGWFILPLNDKINLEFIAMTKKSEIICGTGQKDEMLESNLCTCGGRYQNHQENDPYLKSVFQCPVRCEGDKTYVVPGNCPVCNISLEQVDEVQEHYYL